MGEEYGCSNFHFTYSAFAIKFIQLPYHDVTPIFKRRIGERLGCTHSCVTIHALHVMVVIVL